MRSVYGYFGGRHTFFALMFASAGIALAFRHSLTTEYIGLVGAIQALMTVRAVAQDKAKATVPTEGG